MMLVAATAAGLGLCVTGSTWVAVSAVAGAVAAVVALANVALSQLRDARNRRPNVILQWGVGRHVSMGVREHTITATNVGYGPAIAPMMFGVLEGQAFGADLGVPLLAAGERVEHPFGEGALSDNMAPPAVIVWTDVGGRVWWSTSRSRGVSSGRVGRWPRRFRDWPSAVDLFEREFPDIPVPG